MKDESGQPVSNAARNTWVTETALSTALNMSYMEIVISIFSIVIVIALIQEHPTLVSRGSVVVDYIGMAVRPWSRCFDRVLRFVLPTLLGAVALVLPGCGGETSAAPPPPVEQVARQIARGGAESVIVFVSDDGREYVATAGDRPTGQGPAVSGRECDEDVHRDNRASARRREDGFGSATRSSVTCRESFRPGRRSRSASYSTTAPGLRTSPTT